MVVEQWEEAREKMYDHLREGEFMPMEERMKVLLKMLEDEALIWETYQMLLGALHTFTEVGRLVFESGSLKFTQWLDKLRREYRVDLPEEEAVGFLLRGGWLVWDEDTGSLGPSPDAQELFTHELEISHGWPRKTLTITGFGMHVLSEPMVSWALIPDDEVEDSCDGCEGCEDPN